MNMGLLRFGQIHPEFLRLLWVLSDKQTRNYYALIGAEEEIGSEAFTWSRARTFSFNKNSVPSQSLMPLSNAYTSPCTVQFHSRRQPGHPISSAECLMHGDARASHRATPRPAPPHPAINEDVGTPIVVPSAHTNCAGVSQTLER